MDAPAHATPGAGAGPAPARATRGPRALAAHPYARAAGLALLFVVCWAAAAAKMTDDTGLDGLAVGLALACAPAPVVVGTFLLLGRARPHPRPHLAFALTWGAGAGALAAFYANTWSIEAIAERSGVYQSELLGYTVIAPFVEETAKGAGLVLLLVFRRHWFRGPIDGLVLAAVTAAGFAFTENILYFGTAFGGDSGNAARETAAVFIGRAVLIPFAHPLFTAATGLALGLAVLSRSRTHAVLTGVTGWLVAVGLHSLWNGGIWKSNTTDQPVITVLIYLLIMVPLLVGLFVLGSRLRRRQLTAVRTQLRWYVRAGWFAAHEPLVLSSITDRARQRTAAFEAHGKRGEDLMRRYQWDVTALAELRERADAGRIPAADFVAEERVFLTRLWRTRAELADVLDHTLPTPRWAPVAAPWRRPAPAWAAPQHGVWPTMPPPIDYATPPPRPAGGGCGTGSADHMGTWSPL